ncbi:hypothetical protein GCM10023213_08580 [Prosthecobacter algae]|uniref:Uncharacterized protein n=1 Tax=Prosthecobacter algae TaxID=1144682 RepID=A0ABP9NWK8_9BACT
MMSIEGSQTPYAPASYHDSQPPRRAGMADLGTRGPERVDDAAEKQLSKTFGPRFFAAERG